MKEKPDILGHRELLIASEEAISPSKQWVGDLDRVRRKAVAEAQRDADVAWYGRERQGIRIIDEEAISTRKHSKLIQQAKAEVAREIFEEIEELGKHRRRTSKHVVNYITISHKNWDSLKGRFPKEAA